VIGEEPPKTSDPEVAAKRAIDEAVATLRSLAEGVQARPPAEPRAAGSSRAAAQAADEAFLGRPPLEARLREGFHRLGLVLALACAAAGGVVLLASSDLSAGRVDVAWALPLLLGAVAVYLLCQSMAWVALGFIGEPWPADAIGRGAEEATGSSPVRAPSPGIGGWLWFPVLATALTPVAILAGLYSLAADMRAALSWPLEARAFFLVLALVGIAFLIGWFYALALMLLRRRRFPRVYVALSLWSLALVAGGWLVAILHFGFFDWATFLTIGALDVARAVFIPYMLRSRRARGTFVR